MAEQHGTENLELVIMQLLEFSEKAKKAKQDGRITFWEKLGMLGQSFAFVDLIDEVQQLPLELSDLNDIERERLLQLICSKEECTKNEARRLLSAALKTASGLAELFKRE